MFFVLTDLQEEKFMEVLRMKVKKIEKIDPINVKTDQTIQIYS